MSVTTFAEQNNKWNYEEKYIFYFDCSIVAGFMQR